MNWPLRSRKMRQEKIEIKFSKTKVILTFLGCVAFVLLSLWLVSIGNEQDRYAPIFLEVVGWLGTVFFGFCGMYALYKLFDTRPGLIIDENGILDNSSAASGHLIKWERIIGLRMGQVRSTKFILLDLVDPERFVSEVSGVKKALMLMTYKMYGTPASIASTALACNFDELYDLIEKCLKSKMKI